MHRFLAVVLALIGLITCSFRLQAEDLRLQAEVLHRFESVQPHMGTLVRLTVFTHDEQEASRAFRAAFDRIAALDASLSDYREDSELNRITASAVGTPVKISDDLFEVLHASQQLAAATGGAFDITQGPVIRLWREARKTGRLPDAEALRDARARSGFRKLHLDAAHRTVSLDAAGMSLDVGGIAKGYAASQAIGVLSKMGVRSALAAVSGDLAFSGAPPGQNGWKIAVASGEASEDTFPDVLELTNAAVSTSGSSAQHLDVDGRRYSHIIDPSSGNALDGELTVTIVARRGIDADGLATAVSVLGPERGLALVEAHGDAAALILQRTAARPTVLSSSRFGKLLRGASRQLNQ
jgi:thiamine biosynthesis lipoprotein